MLCQEKKEIVVSKVNSHPYYANLKYNLLGSCCCEAALFAIAVQSDHIRCAHCGCVVFFNKYRLRWERQFLH